MPTTLSPVVLTALQREADRVALRIVRICRIPQHEREDLRQDLLADLLSRLKHFDAARGSLGAFAASCFAHRSARLTERILRGRAAMMPVSLDGHIPGADSVTLADTLAAEDSYGAWMGQPTDAVAALERRLDLDRALSTLPHDQLRHCIALADKERGIMDPDPGSRATAFRRARELRLRLLAAGLAAAA